MPLPARTCDLGRISYAAAADLQRSLRAAREAGAINDVLLMLEHEPVITTGHRTEPHEIERARSSGIPIVPTERGGKATYHGPGQVVAYPILDLRDHGSDVRRFVRSLEHALIATLASWDVEARRNDGYPGVWAGDRKIASIGVRVTRWISFHGVALNVDCDLEPFTWFTPCGIEGVEMTSIARELGAAACPAVPAVLRELARQLHVELGLDPQPTDAGSLARLAAGFPCEQPQLVDVRDRQSAARHRATGARVVDLAGLAATGAAGRDS